MNNFDFKKWFSVESNLSENIVVKYYNKDHILLPKSPPLPVDIFIEWENGFASLVISAFKAEMPDTVSLGTQPTHVAIIKQSPIEAYSGPEFGFLKNLIKEINQLGLRPIPYKEEGTIFGQAIKSLSPELEKDMEKVNTGFTTGEELPDFELGQDAQHKIFKSISVSRQTGSWAQIFQANDNASNIIEKLISAVKKAAQPLIDFDFLDSLQIKPRSGGQSIFIQSKSGKSKQEEAFSNDSRNLSQLKYFADTYLANAPNFKKIFLKMIESFSQKDFYAKSPAKDFKIPIKDVINFNKIFYNENEIINAFLNSIGDNEKIQQLEVASRYEKSYEIIRILDYYFWQNEIEKIIQEDKIDLYLPTIHSIFFEFKDVFQKLEPEKFEYFSNQIKNNLENLGDFESGLRKDDLRLLADLAPVIGMNAKDIARLDQMKAEILEKETQAKNLKAKQQEKERYLLPVEEIKYLMLGEHSWKTLPFKYLGYDSEINWSAMANDLVEDDEEIRDQAIDKATEMAYEDIEERKSETYGQDEDEVNDDIGYYWDDFIQDREEEIEEDMSDDEIIDLVTTDLRQDFIDWRIKMLQDEEESESWKYEPEPDQSTIYKIMDELLIEKLWQEGLVVMRHEKENNIEITLAKENWPEFKPVLKQTIQYNLDLKQEDRWTNYAKVAVEFMPEGSDAKSAYDWLKEL